MQYSASQLDRIDDARQRVLAQIEERDQSFRDHRVTTEPWATVVRMQRYVRTLAAEDLLDIRVHVDPFIGTLSANFYLNKDAGLLPLYEYFGEGVSPEHWAYEPEIPSLAGRDYGLRVNGRLLNDVAVTYQRYICNLRRTGILEWAQGGIVLEIGAGHGGFAHLFAEQCACRYVIVDLPETLFFSAVFLTVHGAGKRIYVYRPGDDLKKQLAEALDFVLIPDYRADALRALPELRLAINHVSFPEMETEVLRRYLRVIKDRLHGYLVAVNYRSTPGRTPVDTVLSEFFELAPSMDQVRAIAGDAVDHITCRPTMIGCSDDAARRRLAGKATRDAIDTTGTRYSCRFTETDCALVVTSPPPEGFLRRIYRRFRALLR